MIFLAARSVSCDNFTKRAKDAIKEAYRWHQRPHNRAMDIAHAGAGSIVGRATDRRWHSVSLRIEPRNRIKTHRLYQKGRFASPPAFPGIWGGLGNSKIQSNTALKLTRLQPQDLHQVSAFRIPGFPRNPLWPRVAHRSN